MRYNDKSKSYLVGATVGLLAIAFLALAFQSWLLGLILSWFGINFSFWQCFAIVFLANSIFGAAKSSN
jgi:uncharacterized membrane protein